MTKVEKAIKTLEEKGYEVVARENRWLGKLSEEYPVVYDIYNGSDKVYGANGIAPEMLEAWTDLKPVKKEEVDVVVTESVEVDTAKAKEWDDCYNEGGEGYNPYTAPKHVKEVKMVCRQNKSHFTVLGGISGEKEKDMYIGKEVKIKRTVTSLGVEYSDVRDGEVTDVRGKEFDVNHPSFGTVTFDKVTNKPIKGVDQLNVQVADGYVFSLEV